MSLDDLKNVLCTPAWIMQFNKDTSVYNLLESLPGTSNEEELLIPTENILLLGLLFCSGDTKDKAALFYECVNPST